MKFNHMMNGEAASCQVGRKLYTHVKVRIAEYPQHSSVGKLDRVLDSQCFY